MIANPAAGRGLAPAFAKTLANAINARLQICESAENTQSIARSASEKLIVVVGGDGTFHDVAVGALGRDVELLVVPLGTGNDYATELGLTDSLDQVIGAIRSGRRVRARVGLANGEPFVSSLSIGIFAEAIENLRRAGAMGYFIGGLRTLVGYRSVSARIDGVGCRLLGAHVGVTRTSGGGYRLTPGSAITEDAFGLVAISARPALVALAQWPLISRGIAVWGSTHWRSTSVQFEQISRYQIDGELRTAAEQRLDVRLSDATLTVVGAPP